MGDGTNFTVDIIEGPSDVEPVENAKKGVRRGRPYYKNVGRTSLP